MNAWHARDTASVYISGDFDSNYKRHKAAHKLQADIQGGAIKTVHFLTACNSSIWWRVCGDPYIKLFGTLARIRIFLQLNILCTTLVKPHTALRIMIHPLLTVDMLRPLYVFSSVLNFTEAERSIIKTCNTLSGMRIVSWILPQLDILCTIAVKRNYA